MQVVRYRWNDENGDHVFDLVHVRGTHGEPYAFGEPPTNLLVDVPDFFIATVPVTQRLWSHIMGPDANPAVNRGPDSAARERVVGRAHKARGVSAAPQ